MMRLRTTCCSCTRSPSIGGKPFPSAVCPLALSQVQHEGDALIRSIVESGRADQHRQTAAVLAQVLSLEGLRAPGPLHLFYGPCVTVAPFRRYSVLPAHAAGDEILAI